MSIHAVQLDHPAPSLRHGSSGGSSSGSRQQQRQTPVERRIKTTCTTRPASTALRGIFSGRAVGRSDRLAGRPAVWAGRPVPMQRRPLLSVHLAVQHCSGYSHISRRQFARDFFKCKSRFMYLQYEARAILYGRIFNRTLFAVVSAL